MEDTMRWGHNPRSHIGSKRVITKFLFLPKRIGLETRWLEKAQIEQEFGWQQEGVDRWRDWSDVRWANK